MRSFYLFLILVTAGMHFSTAQNITGTINQVYTHTVEPGVSVAIKKEGKVHYYAKGLANLESSNAIDSLTTFRMASVSKQFTAMSIYQLIQSKNLAFDTKIRSLLPELPEITQNITVAQLINHSSGILDYENLMEEDRNTPLLDGDVLTYISTVDSLYFTPGSQFRYSNTGYCLLALLVERITGKGYTEAVQELIFKPLSMKNATVYPTTDNSKRAFGYHEKDSLFYFADQSLTSSTKGDGGIYASAVDYNLWLDKDNPLFSADYWQAMDKFKILVKDNIYYSLGWFVKYDDKGTPWLFHSGESTGFHNIVLFYPYTNRMISVFSNRDDSKIADFFDLLTKDRMILNQPLFWWLNKVYSNEI